MIFWLRIVAAGGGIDVIAAELLQLARERDGVLDRPAALDPVDGRDAHAERLALGPGLAHRLEDLERQAHAVLEAAAVGIGALVRQRREELMQQVAVRGVQLDHVEAEALAALARQ